MGERDQVVCEFLARTGKLKDVMIELESNLMISVKSFLEITTGDGNDTGGPRNKNEEITELAAEARTWISNAMDVLGQVAVISSSHAPDTKAEYNAVACALDNVLFMTRRWVNLRAAVTAVKQAVIALDGVEAVLLRARDSMNGIASIITSNWALLLGEAPNVVPTCSPSFTRLYRANRIDLRWVDPGAQRAAALSPVARWLSRNVVRVDCVKRRMGAMESTFGTGTLIDLRIPGLGQDVVMTIGHCLVGEPSARELLEYVGGYPSEWERNQVKEVVVEEGRVCMKGSMSADVYVREDDGAMEWRGPTSTKRAVTRVRRINRAFLGRNEVAFLFLDGDGSEEKQGIPVDAASELVVTPYGIDVRESVPSCAVRAPDQLAFGYGWTGLNGVSADGVPDVDMAAYEAEMERGEEGSEIKLMKALG